MSISQMTPHLKLMSRDITFDAGLVEVALRNNRPLFEVVGHRGQTLEFTPNQMYATKAFDKAQTATLWSLKNGVKWKERCKINGREIQLH